MKTPAKLTIKQLRKYKGMEDVTEKDALEIIDGLYKLSHITYTIYEKERKSKPAESKS